MERLPYIDEHAITIAANRPETWIAMQHTLGVPFGFVLDEARPPERYVLKGRHPFSIYRWVFELDELSDAQTRVRSQSWAAFPGIHGRIYRALVISSGAHRIAVRWMLKRIAAQAHPDHAPVT